jgi:hypothetical protein
MTTETLTRISRREAAEHFAGLPAVRKFKSGNYEPGPWFTSPPGEGVWGSWGIRARPGRRGLTFMDLDAAEGGNSAPAVAEHTRRPRGAGDSGEFPGPRPSAFNEKYEVWSDNLLTLYEEAVARQWSATADIPWEKLEPLRPDLERALCQYLTFLTGNEFLANDQIGPMIAQINPTYMETKMFLATQIMDEARHSEVFRKRLLANGGGMGMYFSFPLISEREKAASAQPALGFEARSFALHIVAESVVLDYFRFGEFLGKQEVDKEIFRRVMQDEARHVSFGTMHLKYWLEHLPRDQREQALAELHIAADVAEIRFGSYFMLHPSTIEAMAILAADGPGRIEKGLETYRVMWHRTVTEYLNRCERAGFQRRAETLLPLECPV